MKADAFINSQFGEILKKDPIVLIDAGASGGIPRAWRRMGAGVSVLGFEPDKRAFEKLDRSADSEKFINAGAYKSDGVVKLKLTKKQECSSIYEPNDGLLAEFPDAERYGVIGSTDMAVKRITERLLSEEGMRDPDFLKLDTQGADLDVLAGAEDLLSKSIFGVDVEVEFAPIYRGQPLFAEVDIFLRSRGFQLFDMKRYYWKRKAGVAAPNTRGQIIFADAVYFKTYDALMGSVKGADIGRKRAKILKAMAISLIYNKADYALHLSGRATEDKVLSPLENKAICGILCRKPVRIRFKGRGMLARALHKLYLYLRSDEYHFSDEDFGDE